MNSLFAQRQSTVKTFLLMTNVLLVVTMAFISIKYIATPRYGFTINQTILGWLGWATLTTSTLYVSLKYKKECLLIFFVFFVFGFCSKAYLEPVSDQIDHLSRTQEKCRNIDTGDRLNRGLWQYNMNSLFLCDGGKKIQNPEVKLFFIDTLHSFYLSFATTILYTVSRNAGLPAKWSFLSVIIALLFMGTNKFSYFRYYSYGPSFTSLCIYWLWISNFFFLKDKKRIFYGILIFLPTTAIISVNHLQEAVFLSFILSFWIIINLTEKIFHSENRGKKLSFWIIFIFSVFFILPQMEWIKDIFRMIPMANIWEKNQSIVYYWNNIHIMGKIWIPQYRVPDTIGIMGLAPLILAPILFFCNRGQFSNSMQARIILLGVLPFLVLCTPLAHYIWAAHVQIPVYYRIAYSSLYWVPIGYFLYLSELWIKKLLI